MPHVLSLPSSTRMTAAGITAARELGIQVSIAVVDAGAHLIHFIRMDDAMLGSIDLARQKARASLLFRRPSAELGEITRPGGRAYGLQWSNQGLVCVGGGLPVADESGTTVGAIGVSGGSIEEDVIVAEACLNSLADRAGDEPAPEPRR
ncbi:GlcG/HbpS family heme-binding protein [Streptomyces sp. NBC_01244]|uniref:GlcG/HbpS family heme-binding protein n=1 Tax=Streptomyces sp. NBC_01244 TaxID=2903797 RepID=UPI002E115407|nr:heme-binding protein [Streptomyces sp. NBC_01244]